MAGNRADGRTVTAITGGERTLGAAVDAFLAQPRPATTARTYTRTLEQLARQLGRDRPLASVTDEELAAAASQLWGALAPRTWNRHLATVRSFLSWCRRHGWPAADLELRADRRAAPDDDTRAIPLPELERLWARADVPLRERALWRLLYDSAARAEEVLGLDVGDLDLASRQARPVFLTVRRAAAHRVTAAADLDPASGRARLSYEMAEQLFKRYTGGKTLHQLRHSRLTHLGDANVSAPLLMAISGHKRLATLQRYVQPSQTAVAALLAATDPDRRGR